MSDLFEKLLIIRTPKIGPVRYAELKKRFGSVSAVVESMGFDNEFRDSVMREMDFAYKNNIKINNLPDVHKGVITKIGKNHYQFKSDHVVIDNLVQAAMLEEERRLALTTSAELRHLIPLKCIIKTLKKMDDNIISFPQSISRVLSKYLPKQTETVSEPCPECGSELIREGGCIQCKSCGWSKCG